MQDPASRLRGSDVALDWRQHWPYSGSRMAVTKREHRRAGEPKREAAPRRNPEQTMLTCPICGKGLAERKCKLYCPDMRCGYFLSCADYY